MEPELHKELVAKILLDTVNPQDSLVITLRNCHAIMRTHSSFKEIIQSDASIEHIASLYTAEKPLIALLLGNDTEQKYKEKKELITSYKEKEDIVNNFQYWLTGDERYISNLKFHEAGILIVLKYQLPYNKQRGLRTALHENKGKAAEVLLDSLKVPLAAPYDTNKALLKVTKKCAYSCIALLIKHGANPNLKDENDNTLLFNTILGYIRNRDTRDMYTEKVTSENILAVLPLLTNEYTINLPNNDDEAPLTLANKYAPELVEFLKQHGAEDWMLQ